MIHRKSLKPKAFKSSFIVATLSAEIGFNGARGGPKSNGVKSPAAAFIVSMKLPGIVNQIVITTRVL